MHDQPLCLALDRHIVEQAGRHERLEPRIARGLVEPSVGRRMEIGTHRLGIDTRLPSTVM